MSTEENPNDAKKGAGYLKEKLVIGLSRFTNDEVERAIMKVTSHMLKAPNEKHMARLLQATHGYYNSGSVDHGDVNRYIIDELEKRSHTHNWIVVLKTYVTLHRFMTEGSRDIQRMMHGRMGLFSVRNIKDLADSPDGAAQKLFIEQYIRYLEERNISQFKLADHGVQHRLEADEFLTSVCALDMNDRLPRAFELVLAMFEVLGIVEFRAVIVNNFLTHEAYRRVVGDGRRLYQVLSNRVLAMLDQFDDFTTPQKQRWLILYQRYDKAVKAVARLFQSMNASDVHWGESIPVLKLLPETLLKRLQDDVAYSAVEAEDLSAVLGSSVAASVAQQQRATADSPSPAAAEAVQQTEAKVSPSTSEPLPVAEPASVITRATAPPAPAPAALAMDDLFGSPLEPKQAANAVVVQLSTVPPTRENPFGWQEPQKPSPYSGGGVASSALAFQHDDPLLSASAPSTAIPISRLTPAPAVSATPVVSAVPASRQAGPSAAPVAAEFDPFAPVPSVPPSVAPSAAGRGDVDFFFSNATPQQQYAANRSNPSGSSQPPSAVPFSELASQSKARAW